MEERTKGSLSPSHNKITAEERKVCEILLNLPFLIKISKLCIIVLPSWGAKRRRSSLNLPRHHRRPEKKVRIVAGDSSPASTLGFPASESDDKEKQFQIGVNVTKKKTKEELLATLKELVQTRDILTRELEKVKTCHNERKAYNAVLKAKQEELHFKGRETNSERSTSLNLEMELSKSLNLETERSQNITPFPLSVEIHHTYYPHFLTLIQHQHQHNYPFHYPFPPGLPDLNTPFDEVENLHPLDRNVKSHEDDDRERAAKARKRRIVRLRERKLNLSAFKTSKC